ncbi:MAG TPA: MBL fold metallo-hydrolase [Desulfitobacterium dehalogenans]|uniref:MBL fold metallo-hydrolase n=1 Tax=Desulfitobacterium dehalogenans TaxID=36854 RepID=A0A7C6Z5Z7_9FIRM|nr:MBL fold metallo-hydrolase [Desulfitobacterium dehalogenans]
MHLATLASGSSGNSIVVGNGKRNILVDCGISLKAALHNLSILDISPLEIEGIFITHEHSDHIKGAGAVARKLKIPIYASARIWDELNPSIGKLKDEQRVVVEDSFSCAGMRVHVFPTSHDSKESFGVRVEVEEPVKGQSKRIGIATDTGIITEEMHHALKGCDALVVEANHDREMLWQGSYPWYLKKRISGDYGHLENSQLAEGLLQWIEGNTRRIVLAHLSDENNTPEIALSTILRILKESRVAKENPDLRLRVAPRYTPHELIVLDEY